MLVRVEREGEERVPREERGREEGIGRESERERESFKGDELY